MDLKKMLKAKDAATPNSGFNLVGLDEFERDIAAAVYIISHHTSAADADAARAAFKKENPKEKTAILSSKSR